MRLVLLTAPDPLVEEHHVICQLFSMGLDTLHIRKPQNSENQIRDFINKIPTKYHSRLMLHSHHQLTGSYNVKGVHYTESNRPIEIQRIKRNIKISTSFHSINQLEQYSNCTDLDYAFLSPVFDSISKQGYKSAQFDVNKLKAALAKVMFNTYALGGVQAENIYKLHELGFKGVAVLGAIWKSLKPNKDFHKLINECRKYED